MTHVSLKCHLCLVCVREGDITRRAGAIVVTAWTAVGPAELVLCGRCAKEQAPGVMHILAAAQDEVLEVLEPLDGK